MLKNKTAIITGANRGIGFATVKIFAENHANIYACAREKNQAFENTLLELSKEYNVSIQPLYFDVTDYDQAKKIIREHSKASGKIDILVNNAGISVETLFSMTSLRKVEETMKVNYLAQVNLSQIVSRYMMHNKSGSIINVASVAGIEAEQGGLAYGSSKAAIIFATRTMALELGKYGVRANSVSPGFIDTDMWNNRNDEVRKKILSETPLGRQGEPEEVAKTILFLASDMSSYITGQNIIVDGGREICGGVMLSGITFFEDK